MGGAYSPPRRGGWRDSLIEAGAPGAKREPDRAKPQLMVSLAKRSAGLTTPAAPLRWLCGIFLMAQPSPLRGGECIPLRQRLEDGALHHILSDIDLVGVH